MKTTLYWFYTQKRSRGFYFRENKTSFTKIKPREITLSLAGVSKSCPGREFLTWQMSFNVYSRK